MNKIYTRTGDNGSTSIHGGIRVPKTDIRIETNGSLDELNVAIGSVRTSLPTDHQWQDWLKNIQLNLMSAMSIVATRNEMREDNPNSLPEDLIENIENIIDSINSECSPTENFILPGGTAVASLLHQARVTARRAERNLWWLHSEDNLPHNILQYVNRLSDLFFIMARYEIQHSGNQEEIWRKFGYKRK